MCWKRDGSINKAADRNDIGPIKYTYHQYVLQRSLSGGEEKSEVTLNNMALINSFAYVT